MVGGAQPLYMQNKKLIRFVESFILLPILTVSMPIGDLSRVNPNITPTSPVALFQKENTEGHGLLAFNQAVDQDANILQAQADAIDAYFDKYDMPLVGMGMKMAIEARDNGLDYRLIPAISVIETTGGKHMCKNPKGENNPFGWGSCKIGFSSIEESIEKIAWNLGGKNPKTDQHYAGKTTEEILRKYNPPSIVPNYTQKVMKVMNSIGQEDVFVVDKTIS